VSVCKPGRYGLVLLTRKVFDTLLEAKVLIERGESTGWPRS